MISILHGLMSFSLFKCYREKNQEFINPESDIQDPHEQNISSDSNVNVASNNDNSSRPANTSFFQCLFNWDSESSCFSAIFCLSEEDYLDEGDDTNFFNIGNPALAPSGNVNNIEVEI